MGLKLATQGRWPLNKKVVVIAGTTVAITSLTTNSPPFREEKNLAKLKDYQRSFAAFIYCAH